jgi:hypothetical protein
MAEESERTVREVDNRANDYERDNPVPEFVEYRQSRADE